MPQRLLQVNDRRTIEVRLPLELAEQQFRVGPLGIELGRLQQREADGIAAPVLLGIVAGEGGSERARHVAVPLELDQAARPEGDREDPLGGVEALVGERLGQLLFAGIEEAFGRRGVVPQPAHAFGVVVAAVVQRVRAGGEQRQQGRRGGPGERPEEGA